MNLKLTDLEVLVLLKALEAEIVALGFCIEESTDPEDHKFWSSRLKAAERIKAKLEGENG